MFFTNVSFIYLFPRYKLYDLHISVSNWVEAALTLQRHFNLLEWKNEKPISCLYDERQQNNAFSTQFQLKEQLSMDMANLLEKGEFFGGKLDRILDVALNGLQKCPFEGGNRSRIAQF